MPSSARYAKFWSLVVFLTIVAGLSTAQSEPGNTVSAQSEPGDTAPSLAKDCDSIAKCIGAVGRALAFR